MYKFSFRSLLTAVVCTSVILALASCGGTKSEPSAAFTTYVKAYTGGMVSSSSSVRIEFVSPMDVNVDPTSLFSFSPSLKGDARWISPEMVEFVPETDALKPGTEYSAAFKLADVADVKEAELKKFTFSFIVAPKNASLSFEGVRIPEDDPSMAVVEGSVLFSEPVSANEVSDMLSFSYPDGELSVEWEQADEATVSFAVSGIKRRSSSTDLDVKFNGSSKGFKNKLSESISIPAAGEYRVLGATLHDGSDPYIDVRFSEPLDTEVFGAMFYLEGTGRGYVTVSDNIAKVFFNEMGSDGVTLTIDPSLKDQQGRTLPEEWSQTFKRDALAPAVKFAFSGSILPDGADLNLPFRAVNLSAVDIRIIKIYESNVLMYLQDNDLGGDDGIRRSGRLVYKNTIRLDSDPSKDLHQWQDFSVDLGNIMKKEPGAIYRIRLSFNKDYSLYDPSSRTAAVSTNLVSVAGGTMTAEDEDVWDVPNPYYYESDYDWELYNWEDRDNPLTPTYYMESYRFPECSLLASNLGIIAKASDTGKFWVTVNDISTTAPISGAEVSAYDFQLQKIASAKTDADGFVELEPSHKAFAIVVRKDKQAGYLKVISGQEKSLSRFDVGGVTLSSGLKGFVYGERGVWRPGDTLHVSLVIEDRDHVIPDRHPVTMEVYTPQGQFYTKLVNASGVNGFYVFDVPTGASDPTGIWNAYFKVGGATFHKSLHIETVKPNRLKIDLKAGAPLSAGASVPFTLVSNWLTGPAASGLSSNVEMTLSSGTTTFKGYENYDFTSPLSDFSTYTTTLFEKKLDAQGRVQVNVKMPDASDAPGMLNANIVSRVMEPGGDESITSNVMTFSPFKSYVGVRIPEGKDGYLETDTDLNFSVVTVNPEGKPVSGDKVEYFIYKLDWSWWWESRGESLDSYVNSRGVKPVSEGSFTTSSSPSSFSFRLDYPEWGRYLVYVKDVTSGHSAGEIVMIDWPSWRGRSDKSDPNSLTMLSFSTNKSEYKVGEEVTVYIPASRGGRALISLENGRGVISRAWVKTDSGETAYKFKVNEDMAPNFYVHISLLQNRSEAGNDLPVRMYGVQPVLVSNPASRIEPQITMPDVLRPQEEFTIKVREKSGRPMTYTLAIVDEGLLDLTSFKTPDPWNAMYAREALGIKTWDLYDDVFGAFSGKFSPLAGIGGGDEITLGAKQDNRFNPVVKFYGPYTLNKGENSLKVTLPMYVGSVRVMLIAGQDGAYGNAEKTVPVRSPLMILPTLPRKISVGETVTLPVNVFAMENDVRDVKVNISVEGPLAIDGASTSQLTFKEAGDQISRFSLKASDQSGKAKVHIVAQSGSYKAEDTISIDITNPNPPQVKSWTDTLKPGEEESITFDPFTADDENWMQCTVSNFPSVNFSEIFSFASSYQYDCSEQISARGMSLVYLHDLLSADEAAKAEALIPQLIQELYKRQLPDGSFCYFPGYSTPNEWATSMAGQFLTEASNRGYSVSKSVLSSWKKYQKKIASAYRNVTDHYQNVDLQQAYRLYTLALAGSADEASMNRLKAAPDMSIQARWRLAAAYAVAGKKSVGSQLIAGAKAEASYNGSEIYTFGNLDRDRAMFLETSVLLDDMTDAMSRAEEVAGIMEDSYYNTQSAAFCALAMSRLAEKIGDSSIQVAINDTKEHTVRSAKSVCTETIDPSRGSFTVTNKSDGSVFMKVLSRSQTPAGQKVEANAQGIRVTARYTDLHGNSVNPSQLRQGTDFRVEYTVVNESGDNEAIENLALTAMIPSGWEIFNERLFDGASEDTAGYDYKDVRDDRVLWYFSLGGSSKVTFSLRLQAAYEGRFVLPSVSCENMYDQYIRSCTASGWTEVVR